MEKFCVGIDISKDHLDCCLGQTDASQIHTIIKHKRFSNELSGFEELVKWESEYCTSSNVMFVMEATGIYYENLAFFLSDLKLELSVLLPNIAKNYSRSLNVKTKTDDKDAEVLCKLGLERKLTIWQMPTKIMRTLKLLTREFREIKSKLTQSKNQLHAMKYGYNSPDSGIERVTRQIALLNTQLLEIEAEIKALVMTDSDFYVRIQKICTIPGVSFMTSVTIIAETNGFSLIRNAKQLTSYAGLDVQHNQSGQKNGKSRISKKGNRFIRFSLYMPAMSACRFNPTLSCFYTSLSSRKGAKKIAITAVARKLLIQIYTLWKNNETYDPEYEIKKVDKHEPVYTG